MKTVAYSDNFYDEMKVTNLTSARKVVPLVMDFIKPQSVCDIGCGVGYYTKLMGKNGASVLGIDPIEKYIDIAKKNSPQNVEFKKSAIGNERDLDWIHSESFDFIFMSA